MEKSKTRVRYATHELEKAGQSPWLDFINREILKNGKLKAFIQDYGVLGVTSNPSIFEKAINQPDGGYDADIRKFVKAGASTLEIYDALTIRDIQQACDLFLPLYKRSGGEYGFVSLEVVPTLAHDEEGTVRDALRLYKAVGRANVMIKIPATKAGVASFRRVIAAGVNVNVTLMFSLNHYQAVAKAYIEGLKDFQKKGGKLGQVHSVASVFVSRIDSYLDKKLEENITKTSDSNQKRQLESLLGQAAIANSKNIYQEFKLIFGSDEFQKLRNKGAFVQKVLWASTSTKNPKYSDLIYVEPLIGRETVNTMPLSTLEAFNDHGKVQVDTIEERVDSAGRIAADFKKIGYDLNEVGDILQDQGVRAFNESFEVLMGSLEKKRQSIELKRVQKTLPKTTYQFCDAKLEQDIQTRMSALAKSNLIQRFLNKDASLWKQDANHQKVILNRLGWLNAASWIQNRLFEIDLLKKTLELEMITDIVLLGMGGSSLAPEVMSSICPRAAKSPRFQILDSTDPASIQAVCDQINFKKTWFIVASKSGSTIETSSQFKYFYDQVRKMYAKSAEVVKNTGSHFIAITDSGSDLEKQANALMFRSLWINPSDIGGRYSALSFFGMVPAALMGIDVRKLLDRTQLLLEDFSTAGISKSNSSVYLGAVLGMLARAGKNKINFQFSKKLESFGTWLEQLIAESTGKEGRGIVPIEGEDLWAKKSQNSSFICFKLKSDSLSPKSQQAMEQLSEVTNVIQIEWADEYVLGAEFLRWEIITSVASAVMEVNPFDEPNVRESKEITGKLLDELKKNGKLPEPKEIVNIRSFIPFEQVFQKIKTGSYLAILAYIPRNADTQKRLAVIRKTLGQYLNIPILVGFGPRYLHSIGQLYKGGTKEGVFIEFIKSESKDLRVPGEAYTFGELKRAQALGDLQAIQSKNLPILPIELGKDALNGLDLFCRRLEQFINKK